MKAANPWITYRTRFLVTAKQLTTSLTFTDVLGRQHSGRKGDYLVESSDGVLSIASRRIFEDVYVPLLPDETPDYAQTQEQIGTPRQRESLQQSRNFQLDSSPMQLTKRQRRGLSASFPLTPSLSRKAPQPCSDSRNSSPGFRSL
ncbi:MAG: hypothetical protein WB660_08485 [Candidatus Sulfotelmatobacter sp.]